MGNRMVTHEAQQHNGRFVAAIAEDAGAEYQREYDAGRMAYRTGKRITACVTDAMRDGWTDAFNAGADTFYRHMMMEAAH